MTRTANGSECGERGTFVRRRRPLNGTSASIPLHHGSIYRCIQPRLCSICWAWHTDLGLWLDGPCTATCKHGGLAFAVHILVTHIHHAHTRTQTFTTRAATFLFSFFGGPQQTCTHTIRSNKYLSHFSLEPKHFISSIVLSITRSTLIVRHSQQSGCALLVLGIIQVAAPLAWSPLCGR